MRTKQEKNKVIEDFIIFKEKEIINSIYNTLINSIYNTFNETNNKNVELIRLIGTRSHHYTFTCVFGTIVITLAMLFAGVGLEHLTNGQVWLTLISILVLSYMVIDSLVRYIVLTKRINRLANDLTR